MNKNSSSLNILFKRIQTGQNPGYGNSIVWPTFSLDLYYSPQGDKGDAGQEGGKGDRGEIGLKGKEGPLGPPGLVGVRVSVTAANSKFHSIPMKRQLILSAYKPRSIFFHQGQEGKPGKIGERGKPGEKVRQFTCSGLKNTIRSWMSVNLLSCTSGWIVLCCCGKQTVTGQKPP